MCNNCDLYSRNLSCCLHGNCPRGDIVQMIPSSVLLSELIRREEAKQVGDGFTVGCNGTYEYDIYKIRRN